MLCFLFCNWRALIIVTVSQVGRFRNVHHSRLIFSAHFVLFAILIANAASSGGVVLDDAESFMTRCALTQKCSLITPCASCIYLSSLPLSCRLPVSTSENSRSLPTTRRHAAGCRVAPLRDGETNSENILLQTTGDGKESRIVLEGSAGGGRFPPSIFSAEDLTGAYVLLANIRLPSLTFSRILLRRCHGT